MSLYLQIKEDYKNALRKKDSITKEVLNFVVAQIKNKQIENKRELDDDEVMRVIKKEIKVRKETIGFLKKAMKMGDAEVENKKIATLEAYLPEAIGEEKLKEIIKEYIKNLGIVNLQKQRGQLMGAIMKEYGAEIDGGLLNKIISSLM